MLNKAFDDLSDDDGADDDNINLDDLDPKMREFIEK